MFHKPTKRSVRRFIFHDAPMPMTADAIVPMDKKSIAGITDEQQQRSVTLTGIPFDWTLRDIASALERLVQQGDRKLFGGDAQQPDIEARLNSLLATAAPAAVGSVPQGQTVKSTPSAPPMRSTPVDPVVRAIPDFGGDAQADNVELPVRQAMSRLAPGPSATPTGRYVATVPAAPPMRSTPDDPVIPEPRLLATTQANAAQPDANIVRRFPTGRVSSASGTAAVQYIFGLVREPDRLLVWRRDVANQTPKEIIATYPSTASDYYFSDQTATEFRLWHVRRQQADLGDRHGITAGREIARVVGDRARRISAINKANAAAWGRK